MVYKSATRQYNMSMDHLIEQFRHKIARTPMHFVRNIHDSIQWNARLIGIRGARGVGKTTLLLQHIKQTFAQDLNKVLYVSLDNLWFSNHSLLELADSFAKKGGTHLFLDEVHRYSGWSQILKNLYDDYPELFVTFTGSSLLHLLDAKADLSRRAVVYTMQGLSFREYLALAANIAFPAFSLDKILSEHEAISAEIVSQFKPFQFFPAYLQTGYYPYFAEEPDTYPLRLEETINMTLELELPLLRRLDITYVPKLKQLLSIIAESAPFIPNISKLSEKIGLNRQTMLTYLGYLSEAKLIRPLYRDAHGISALQKPNKLFLENTNLMYLFRKQSVDIGNARETFLANQLACGHELSFADTGDFIVDGNITIEVGGKNKTRKQIKDISDSYVAADNIEYGFGRKIPLWLFGFLY